MYCRLGKGVYVIEMVVEGVLVDACAGDNALVLCRQRAGACNLIEEAIS